MGLLDSKTTQLIPYLYQLTKSVEEVVEEVEEEIADDVLLTETDTEDEVISENSMPLKIMHSKLW